MKCQSYIRLMVKFLISLDQNGKVGLISMEQEFEKLLECIVLFSPPGKICRHFCKRKVQMRFIHFLISWNCTFKVQSF